MNKIIKFPQKKRRYSDYFKHSVSPAAVVEDYMKRNPSVSYRTACAIVDAIIANTYSDLCIEEDNADLIEGWCEDYYTE